MKVTRKDAATDRAGASGCYKNSQNGDESRSYNESYFVMLLTMYSVLNRLNSLEILEIFRIVV